MAWSLTALPIHVVPDITSVQVQVNAFAPALSLIEVEKQVNVPDRGGAVRHAQPGENLVVLAQRALPR
jgi:hypothetical protein